MQKNENSHIYGKIQDQVFAKSKFVQCEITVNVGIQEAKTDKALNKQTLIPRVKLVKILSASNYSDTFIQATTEQKPATVSGVEINRRIKTSYKSEYSIWFNYHLISPYPIVLIISEKLL